MIQLKGKKNVEETTVEAKEESKEEAVTETTAANKPEKKAKYVAPVIAQDVLGSMSDKVAFVAALGNPGIDDTTTTKDPATGEEVKQTTSAICGYRFKALVAMQVPDFGTPEGLKKNIMDYQADMLGNMKEVKKGEEFDMTALEAAYMMSAPEFNAVVTGGNIKVFATYAKTQLDALKSNQGFPRVSLRGENDSIKANGIIDVLTCKKVQAANGKNIKELTINPGFEKFKSLCVRYTALPGTKKDTANALPSYNVHAAAFMDIARQKMGK